MKLIAGLVLAVACCAHAQFEILDGKTTASLRGIDAVSPQVAWASGSGGTVLLTTDGGANWKHCAVPPGGEKLDFRGVRGYDAKKAWVMASGKGAASAIYKTTDGCSTWQLAFGNPDRDGFFDGFVMILGGEIFLVGDQVDGRFTFFDGDPTGKSWKRASEPGLEGLKGAGGFAASNSGLITPRRSRDMGVTFAFGTSATELESPKVYLSSMSRWTSVTVPMPPNGPASGIFSLASAGESIVAVGGNYTQPSDSAGTAAYSCDGGYHWQLAMTTPSGYRSAVDLDHSGTVWIAVGPTGTDVSRDNGKNWTPLKPTGSDAADADKNWNAISLPFVVGSKGKLGKLNVKF